MSERDAQLVLQCLAGDESAWLVMFRRYDAVMRLPLKKAGVFDADVLNEVCGRVWCLS